MKRRTMTILAPLANEGDSVNVLNYRMRPAQWELGTVRRTPRFTPGWGWLYSVRIERPVIDRGPYRRSRGGGYDIDVRDDAIKVIR